MIDADTVLTYNGFRAVVIEAGTEVKSIDRHGKEHVETVTDDVAVISGAIVYVTQSGYDRIEAVIKSEGIKTK